MSHKLLYRLLFFLSLLLYGVVGSYQLHLPGLGYDEALDAVPAMHVLQGQPLDIEASVEIAGHEWPLMVMSYVGVTTTYLALPMFAWFGISYLTLRVTMLLVGLCALLLTWFFLREYLDEQIAAVSTLLLAVNPTFLFWSRLGAYVSLPMLPLAILALWALYHWYRQRGDLYLVLAAFCLGLGLSTKLLFLWLWVALGLAWLLLSPLLRPWHGWRTWLWPLERASLRTWLLAALAALLGSSPLLLSNLQSGFRTIEFMQRNAVRTELYGVNNLDILGNLRTVFLTDFRTLLDGSLFTTMLGGPHANPLAVPVFLLSVALVGWLLWKKETRYSPRRLLLLGILLGAIIFQSAFTITGLGATHLMILWPIPQALVSVALFEALEHWLPAASMKRYKALLLPVAVAVLAGAELWTTWQYHQSLARTGGLLLYSDAIHELAHDLEQNGITEPVALDWGFRRNLQLLSQGRINAEERFIYSQSPGAPFVEFMNWRVTQEPTLYLFHVPEHTSFQGHWPLFEEAAYRHHLKPVLWKQYQQGNGESLYLVYQLEPVPPLFESPPVQHPLAAQVGEEIALLGYDLDSAAWQPGETVPLTLYWQAQAKPARSYKVFVHLFDEQGTTWAQSDSIPMSWGHPTTEWLEGEIVPDRVRLELRPEVPPGRYALFVGMYDEATGERLPLFVAGQRQAGDTLRVGEVEVGD